MSLKQWLKIPGLQKNPHGAEIFENLYGMSDDDKVAASPSHSFSRNAIAAIA